MDRELHNLFGRERISGRLIDELIGMARGLVADGELSDAEINMLERWLAVNVGLAESPIIATLYRRVEDLLRDGHVSEDERRELFDTLTSFVGVPQEAGELLPPTCLPLCNPKPQIEFSGKQFCFTGTFAYGSRGTCEALVQRLGGASGSLTRKTNYLVIGSYVTEAWKHSSFGLKIIKGMEMRDNGVPIAIIDEKHWSSLL